MARRRSARLASGSKTPKSSTAAPSLASLTEREESPDVDDVTAVPQSLNALVSSPTSAVPQTPAGVTTPKPPLSEMHPSKVHPTTGIPSSALRLGFTDIKPTTRTDENLPPGLQATPSKVNLPPSSPFTFRFGRDGMTSSDKNLGPQAQEMMDKIRADAAKIKVQLAAAREEEKLREEQEAAELGGRKIATAKGKAGRYSAVHMAEFKKMDSIANHPSAFRAHLTRTTPLSAGVKRSPSKPNLNDSEAASPVRAGIKRSQSKANLNEPEASASVSKGIKRSQSKSNLNEPEAAAPVYKELKRSQSKANLHEAEQAAPVQHGIKRSQSKANLANPDTLRTKQPETFSNIPRFGLQKNNEPPSPAKRARQLVTDDATTNRPVSRDGSFLPLPKSSGKDAGVAPATSGITRSKSNLASLMTPTKSSLARAASVKSPVQGSLITSPSKTSLGSLTHSATTANICSTEKAVEKDVTLKSPGRQTRTPSSRLDRVKAMFRGHKTVSPEKAKSGIPLATAFTSKTPSVVSLNKELPHVPLTTPGRKLEKRVGFTPETRRAAIAQNSPSPVKNSVPLTTSKTSGGEIFYPSLETVMAEADNNDKVSYPDLSGSIRSSRPLPELPVKQFKAALAEPGDLAGPSSFTFRTDHTINFSSANASPSAFGNSPGQVGVRRVRPSSIMHMPGSFPASVSEVSSPNKENQLPADDLFRKSKRPHVPSPVMPNYPHGIVNKKRARVSTDEEEAEQEAAERAAKKRKQAAVPEGEALLAPRLVGASAKRPVATPSSKLRAVGLASAGTPSPSKKKGSLLSMSRLNMLARPKNRK